MREIDFLGKGVKFPFALAESPQEKGKKLAWAEYEDSIAESIRIILATIPGERVMRPDFGSDLHRLAFAPNTPDTAAQAVYYVQDALKKWEPRIEDIEVDAAIPQGGDYVEPGAVLEIKIEYKCTVYTSFLL